MPKLTIDGIEIDVEQGTSVLQACEQLGIEIPRFCYHDRLSVPANCRMCLVEQEGAPKPVASCAVACADNMVIRTNSEKTHKARKGTMEMLLINHPLDCPICDQGGECDLQDQAVGYGFDRSRYAENKRAVEDKYMGPLIKTIMTRCIHCTRCIRFADEIAGVPEIGALGRSEHMEVGTYIEEAVSSELSGNLIDVCPVGALTSKPYAFNARPWELRKTDTIDVMDAVGTNIRADARGSEVLRILPRLNEDVNEEWLADKGRFSYDGLMKRRLDRPYVRRVGKLVETGWTEALSVVAHTIGEAKPDSVAVIAGDQMEAESLYAMKKLGASLGIAQFECRQDGAIFDCDTPVGVRFNTTIAGIEHADAILLIGTNPRWEAPLVNARIRKTVMAGNVPVARIGAPFDLTYPVQDLGAGAETLQGLLDGKIAFATTLAAAKRPMLILGMGALRRTDGGAVQGLARQVAEKFGMILPEDGWNGFNILHTAASRMAALTLGYFPNDSGKNGMANLLQSIESGKTKVVYSLAADEWDAERAKKAGAFLIYQSHHGDKGAKFADVILPSAAYTEKNGLYMNLEGRVQRANQASYPVGDAREDWRIVRALSDLVGKTLPFDTLAQLRQNLFTDYPVFAELNTVRPLPWQAFAASTGKASTAAFEPTITNYYQTCAISRASNTMAECTTEVLPKTLEKAYSDKAA